ncbi:MAG: hypothetical protein NTW90_02350 [Nitrosospira sp.]|nr:hypothetical protein [Nitrosospira sp.]
MKTNLSICVLLVLVAFISGCAAPARVANMTVEGQPSQRIAETPLRNNLAIRDVTGGKETNPMWKSNIGSPEFEQALEGSLRAVGLLAPRQGGLYVLTAHLEKVDQPYIGVNMTVTAWVRYMVTERATGKEVFDKTLAVPYTASFTDSLYGVERLRLANEGAVRASITQLIDDLFRLNIQSISMN